MPPYETAIGEVHGIERPRPRRPVRGRPHKPEMVMPADPCYATARERREDGRVVDVARSSTLEMLASLRVLSGCSTASTTIGHDVR